jgi:subtilisin family serine protease
MVRSALFSAALATALLAPRAHAAWMWDQNQNKLDDRMEQVETLGLTAAHEDGDLGKRLRFALMSTVAPYEYGVYIGYDHHPTDADAQALQALGVPVQVRYRSIPYLRSRVTLAQALQVAQLPGVTRVETIPMMYAVNDVASRTLRARGSDGTLHPSVWKDLGVTGRGVVVAIFDTGVNDEPQGPYPGHESLRGKFLGGGSFFSGDPNLNTAIDASENPFHTDPEGTYHGTHVAGTAIGSGGPQGLLGEDGEPGFFSGVAPDARLVDCKVLSDAGAGFGSADALDWIVYHRTDDWGLTGADTVYRGIDVANLSLGSTDESDGTDANSVAVNAAHKAGIVVCIATGNDGETGWMASPAAADFAVSVGSFTDRNTVGRGDDVVASYSNEGPRNDDGDADHLDEMKPAVLGDGSNIMSALGDPATDGAQYHHINGTSMACPSVAGVAALVRSANPSLSPDQVRQILQDTADHRTDNGKQPPSAVDPFGLDPNYHPSWGWGQVDAYAAVKEAQNPSAAQVVRIAATPAAGPGIRLDWWSQREVGLGEYQLDRASDLGGGPAAWTQLTQVAVAGAAEIHGQPNRHLYSYTDADPGLDPDAWYWYRVRWTDAQGRNHVEPPVRARIATPPVRARLQFSWTHDYADNDLSVRIGTGAAAAEPVWFRMMPGTGEADSVVNVGGVTYTGTKRHYFHVDLTDEDGASTFLPPGDANPWFLAVKEGGYVNTKGRVNDFSITCFHPGGGSTTYAAPSIPVETVERSETVFWIPLDPIAQANHAPVLRPVGARRVGEGLALAFTVEAVDADGDPLALSASGLPSGASFDAGSGEFEWTPGFDQAGDHAVRFIVSDGAFPFAAADTEDVAIAVVEREPGDNQAPRFEHSSDRHVVAGEPLRFRVRAHDPEGGALAYWGENLPGNASFDGVTGTFEWVPAPSQVGTHPVTFRVGDPPGAQDALNLHLVATEPFRGPSPPVACQPSGATLQGVVGPGTDPGEKDIQHHAFEVPANTQRVEGSLLWFGGPLVDLDFYLLDADSNAVQSAASLSDPELLVYNNPAPGTYIWRVVAFTNPDTSEYTISQSLCTATGVAVEDGFGEAGLALGAGRPNPFHGATLIPFATPRDAQARLLVFDLAGRRVKTLHDGFLRAGVHHRSWNGTTDDGRRAASGVYFCRLELEGRAMARKLIMLR